MFAEIAITRANSEQDRPSRKGWRAGSQNNP